MNARELTTVVNEHSDKLVGLRADVKYLLDEVAKLRLLMEDLKNDVKMMEESKNEGNTDLGTRNTHQAAERQRFKDRSQMAV